MAGADPLSQRNPILVGAARRNNLVLRVISSLVMIPLALATAYLGDIVFLLFWTVAALIVLWEWDALVCTHDRNPVVTMGAVSIMGASVLWAIDRSVPALMLLALGLLGIASLASRVHRIWRISGLVYSSCLLLAPVVLRSDPTHGLVAILFIFAVVWMTDIAAYAFGRGLGGPKLIPRVSPNKTWSGAIGGLAAGTTGGVAVASIFGIENLAAVGFIALLLSISSQFGDLMESWIKRQFDVKDASMLIPGHGGLMDRLDGFLTAGVAAALIGLAHGGVVAPGRGLLVW